MAPIYDPDELEERAEMRDLQRRLGEAKMKLDRTYSNYCYKKCGLNEVMEATVELQDLLAEAVDSEE